MDGQMVLDMRRAQFHLLPMELRDAIEAKVRSIGVEAAKPHLPSLLALLEAHAEALVGDDLDGMVLACGKLEQWPAVPK